MPRFDEKRQSGFHWLLGNAASMNDAMSSAATTALIVLATVFWGLNFPLGHRVVAEIGPLEAATLRFALAALVLTALAGASRQSIPLIRHGVILGLLAFVGVAGFNLLFFVAMQKTSAVNGALIMGTNPLVVAVLAAWTLGERPSVRHMIALPIAFAGVAVVVLGNGATIALSDGDLLMIGANLAWALYNVLARRHMPSGSQVGNTAAIMIYSAVGTGIVAAMTGIPMDVPHLDVGIDLAVMSLGGTVMAYLCYNHGIAKLGSAKAALFMNLVPVWAMAASSLMGVDPTATQVAGGVLVIASVLYAGLPGKPAGAAA